VPLSRHHDFVPGITEKKENCPYFAGDFAGVCAGETGLRGAFAPDSYRAQNLAVGSSARWMKSIDMKRRSPMNLSAPRQSLPDFLVAETIRDLAW